ncbi:MAG: hypothetical protein WCK89_09010 [bacterium]
MSPAEPVVPGGREGFHVAGDGRFEGQVAARHCEGRVVFSRQQTWGPRLMRQKLLACGSGGK